VTIRPRLGAALVAALLVSPALADPLFLGVDVPTTLGGVTFHPNQIVRYDAGAYSLALALPQELRILALDLADDGGWYVVPAAPVSVAGSDFTPRDVVKTNGVTFQRVLDGASAGVPSYARIDALLPDGTNKWVLSFDVPVKLGGVEYGRSDLVRYDGAFSLAWDADAGGIPAYANVVGVGREAAGYVVSLDVPARVGGSEVLPGQIVHAGAESLTAVSAGPAWPRASQLRDFAFSLPPRLAGAVPDGTHVPGVPLQAAKLPGSTIALQWGAPCGDGAVDYAVYQGAFGAWATTTPAACSTGAARAWSGPLPAGNVFYLVVPRSGSSEGSYGVGSSGAERPASASACAPQETGSCSAS